MVIVSLRIYKVIPPCCDSLIAPVVSQVEYDDAAVCASVESVAQTLVSLLARRIPNLERYLFSISECHDLLHEVGADRRLLNFLDLFVLEVLYERGLAHVGVTNDNDL
jgi:hypothetical protein